MLVFFTFVILLVLNFTQIQEPFLLWKKSREEWLLDGIGLFFQGIVIPFFQIAVVLKLYQFFLPHMGASLNSYLVLYL